MKEKMKKKKAKNKNVYAQYLKQKANNTKPIRVLYKKVGLTPEVRVISNLYKLKKAIIKRKLDIIPFQNVYIICHNKTKRKNMPINILLDFSNISGDFIVVQINRNLKDFESVSQENIIWYTQALNRKSFGTQINCVNNINNTNKNYKANNELLNINTITSNQKQNITFENKLVDVLSNINLTLSYLVGNNKQ